MDWAIKVFMTYADLKKSIILVVMVVSDYEIKTRGQVKQIIFDFFGDGWHFSRHPLKNNPTFVWKFVNI